MTAPSPAPRRARRPRRAAVRRRRRLLGGGLLAVAAIVAVVGLATGGGGVAPPPPAGLAPETGPDGLFAYDAAHAAQYVARATAGNANVLYTKSPGGAVATARRVAAYRTDIDRAVAGTNIPASLLAGLVFVESAGIPDAMVGASPRHAAGLTQIEPETATLLGLHLDLALSQRLTDEIDSGATGGRLRTLEARREAADARFDPVRALAATVRLLRREEAQLGGRLDLAVVAYHMGPGNVRRILDDYDGGAPVPYVQLYFDVAPDRHPAAYRLLSTLGDDSSLYWWRVLGAERILGLARRDPSALRRQAALQEADDAGGSVLAPPGAAPRYPDPRALSAAYRRRALVPLPRNAAALGLAYDASIGSGARHLGSLPALYRGLAPAAVRALVRVAAAVRALSGGVAPLHVGSAVADARYLAHLGIDAPMAQTGSSFTIDRRYRSAAQADAFQAVLDRLQSLDLGAWAVEGSSIRITAAGDAGTWRG